MPHLPAVLIQPDQRQGRGALDNDRDDQRQRRNDEDPVADAFFLKVEGLAELQRALREVEVGLYEEIKFGLRDGGLIVQEEARKRFIRKVESSSTRRTAEGFRTYIRGGAIVHVEQSIGKTTGLHPEWGALQMTEGLLPARAAKLDEVAERIEDGIGGLLKHHGF